jgi:hypothetical protein
VAATGKLALAFGYIWTDIGDNTGQDIAEAAAPQAV